MKNQKRSQHGRKMSQEGGEFRQRRTGRVRQALGLVGVHTEHATSLFDMWQSSTYRA
jgi:hypothetical protein